MVNHCVIVRRLCVFGLVVAVFLPFPLSCFARLRPCCPQGFHSETHSCADAQEGQEDEVEEAAEEEER